MSLEILNYSFWLRIIVAIICGLSIGIERQIRGKPMGIRTCILICLGTTLFIYLGLQINEGKDVARILGQVVTGIGFLGAGVIMMRGDIVSGVTSAAVVWLLAGIGAAIGMQYYDVALAVTMVALSILVGVEWLEKFYKGLRCGVHSKKKEE